MYGLSIIPLVQIKSIFFFNFPERKRFWWGPLAKSCLWTATLGPEDPSQGSLRQWQCSQNMWYTRIIKHSICSLFHYTKLRYKKTTCMITYIKLPNTKKYRKRKLGETRENLKRSEEKVQKGENHNRKGNEISGKTMHRCFLFLSFFTMWHSSYAICNTSQ